jgi:hypothetical protein
MRLLQRLSAGLGWALVAGAAVFLILEATAGIGDRWRTEAADVIDRLATPTMSRWLAAVAGLALALAATAVVVAQVVPYRRGSSGGVLVDRSTAGELVVRNRAIQTALGELLRDIDGVSRVNATVERSRIHAQIQLIDSANVTAAAAAAREIIDADLWSRTGLSPQPIDLFFQYRRTPARVTT